MTLGLYNCVDDHLPNKPLKKHCKGKMHTTNANNLNTLDISLTELWTYAINCDTEFLILLGTTGSLFKNLIATDIKAS